MIYSEQANSQIEIDKNKILHPFEKRIINFKVSINDVTVFISIEINNIDYNLYLKKDKDYIECLESMVNKLAFNQIKKIWNVEVTKILESV